MSGPLVSAVIPVYNGQRYLRQAIDSVLGQTYQELEVVVINDGSTDASAEIMASYGSRIVAVHQANTGVGGARNTGMRTARGELIAFLDQDDWWEPTKVEKQAARFQADDRLGLVHTDVAHYDEVTGAFVGPLDPAARPDLLVGDCYQRLLLDNQVYNSSVMIRSAVLDCVGLCDPEVRGNTVQDYDLWLRIARQSRLDFVAEPLTVFRVHSDQGTWDRREMLTEEARLLERVIAADETAPLPALRLRMARLYDQLATAQLDAGEQSAARTSAARSLRWRCTRRAALLWAASAVPLPLLQRLRKSN